MPKAAKKARAKQGKPGRNDPCWCSSGRKHKDCHLPIEEIRLADKRRLVEAQDTLWEQLMEMVQGMPAAFPLAFEHFWGGKYTTDQMTELDDLEDRGAARFLTWFVFDHVLEDGKTTMERLAAQQTSQNQTTTQDDHASAATEHALSLNEFEVRLVQSWQNVRFRPYLVQDIKKGQGFTAYDLLDQNSYTVVDQAASRRLEQDEVVIGHIVPIGGTAMMSTPLLDASTSVDDLAISPEEIPTWDLEFPTYSMAGEIAQLTADVREKLIEFAHLHLDDLQRTTPEATWSTLLRERSYIFNHFIMALPVADQDMNTVENFVEQTRFSLLSGVALWRSMFLKQEEQQEEQGEQEMT